MVSYCIFGQQHVRRSGWHLVSEYSPETIFQCNVLLVKY